jgi:hypothetical protein
MGHHNAALGQDQLDVTQAQAEDVIQPHGVADDLGGEPVAVVGIGWRLHAAVSPASADAAMPGYRDNAHRGHQGLRRGDGIPERQTTFLSWRVELHLRTQYPWQHNPG